MQKMLYIVVLIGVLFGLIACGPVEPPEMPIATPASQESLPFEQVLTLGDISDDPAGTIEEFQPLADYLAEGLEEYGVQQGKVVVASDLGAMKEYLRTGEVDIYFDSPYPSLEVYEDVNAYPLARRWKKGVGEYHTVIVARNDSDIVAFEGLLGQMVAFDDPFSTSGYLLPKAYLIGAGYQMNEKDSVGSTVADDEIGYVFAGDEDNVLAWITQGKTAGAMIPSDVYEDLDAETTAQLVVLDRTPSVPRHIALAHPNMEQALRLRLIEMLLSIHETPEGQAILETFERTRQFDELPLGPEGTMTMLQELFAPVR